MAKVRVLSDQVANQIAAGEVIERPASVIKELVENSIDSGATRIEVEFRKGGATYMRIEDNGCGMTREDALLSLERHATSKIKNAKDLDGLLTMGFRGEALPSIASVSKFQLHTREKGAKGGTDVLIDGGRMVHSKDCGMPEGTRMTVSKLFNTVPARRKFLKTVTTEAAHIVHCVRLYALAHPEIGFTLIDDGRILFQSPACERLQDRITEIFGKQLSSSLIEIDEEEDGMRMRGLIGKPSLSRSSRHEMLFFVNNRPVENKTLSYALVESYYGHIPKGRYPVAFLFLDILPERIDVNVHPAKREIRFREEAKARGFAVRTILHALREESNALSEIALKPVLVAKPRVLDESVDVVLEKEKKPTRRLVQPVAPSLRSESRETSDQQKSPKLPPQQIVPAEPAPASKPVSSNWEYLGWAQGEFAVFDTGAGVVLLNVKAVQQRIWYERLLGDFKNHTVKSQRLLLPHPVEFDPVSSAIVEESLKFLGQFGFEVAPFGRNFFRIEGSPTWIEESAVEEFLKELVAALRQGSVSADNESAAIEMIAKKAALKAVRLISKPKQGELDVLLPQLFACEKPLTDPEGRPSLIEISSGEIDKRFQRRNRSSLPDLF